MIPGANIEDARGVSNVKNDRVATFVHFFFDVLHYVSEARSPSTNKRLPVLRVLGIIVAIPIDHVGISGIKNFFVSDCDHGRSLLDVMITS